MRYGRIILVLFFTTNLACSAGDVLSNNPHTVTTPTIEEKYPPEVVELSGKLVIKTYFGPPNFGEDTKTDLREEQPVLITNGRELQLILRVSHKDLIGKKVKVKGSIFQAESGHHHTEEIMDVLSIEPIINSRTR